MIDKHNEAEIETSGAQGIERTEKLIAGETCIGRIRRARLKDGTLLNDVPVYYGADYGNAAFLEDGSRLHMAPETYRKMLTIFLTESSRGRHFLIPSEEESEEAFRICMREDEVEEPAKSSDGEKETSAQEAPPEEAEGSEAPETQGESDLPESPTEESVKDPAAPESDSKESESPKEGKEEKSYASEITENAQNGPEKKTDADPGTEQVREHEAPEPGDQEDTHGC
ncbi:MAG: hypothetical protein PUE98_05745 [Galactobacillus timonensis]|uniref:hypothetical protein n=1 Tax=Galactobacillus timonensis TaxID=2041840 RepID=UPI0024098AEC|nr:hypothetical protein [Galactobacillus timonensis]MDD6599948.1 hypothetical protein [Galactobacillus timonensis]